MSQIEKLNIFVTCPYCGESEWQDVSVAIAGADAEDGTISTDEDGVSDCECSFCEKEFQTILQCFATVRKAEGEE